MRELLIRHAGTIGFVMVLGGFIAGIAVENHFVSPEFPGALVLRGVQVVPVIVVGTWARLLTRRDPSEKRIRAFWGCVGVAVFEIAFGMFLRFDVAWDRSAPRVELFPIVGVQLEKTYTPRSGKSVQQPASVGTIAYVLIEVDGKTRKIEDEWRGEVVPGRDQLVRTIGKGAFGVEWLESVEIKKME